MLYLHDVWVNWFEGEENGYGVCHFHEWRKEDKIELLDQVPLLYITTSLFHYIENDMQDLPKGLMDSIHKRAFIRKGPQRNVLEYACVITDGNDVMALDTVGYQIPIRKSRIIPRQEMLVYDMIENTKQQNYKFEEAAYQKEYHMLSMSPALICGLTRRERQLKQLLMMALDQLQTSKNLEEMRYWLTEWDPKQYPYIRFMDENRAWETLYDGIKYGWSRAHEDLCRKLVKGQPFLEKIWELENDQANEKQKSKNQ